jgi:hypothetical protein
MVVDPGPVSELTLAQVLKVTIDEITQALASLVDSYSERGLSSRRSRGLAVLRSPRILPAVRDLFSIANNPASPSCPSTPRC